MDNPDIKLAVDLITKRAASFQPFYNYYEGLHSDNFSSEKFKNKFGKRLQKLRENLCRTVVKAPASRLEVIGFQSEKDDVQKRAWEIWKQNNMPKNCGKVHREAIRTGDGFCIVWPDTSGKVRIYPQTAGNVAVWRNVDDGSIEKAAKRWEGSDGRYYLTIYYPDRIEKYVSKLKAHDTSTIAPEEYIPREIAGEPFPLPNPFRRVPVFAFSFDEDTDDKSNSILKDVMPLNDALNKSYADIFVAQEFNAIRQRWIAGLQFEKDEETGKDIVPYDFDSQAWTSPEAETKFGEFSDADLEQMLKVKQETVRDIALVSGIPPSYFNLDTADFPSGEALRKIEARFTAIVQDSQRSFGESWGEVMSFALSIEGGGTDGVTIEPQWTDAAPIGESETLDNLGKKKNLGWSIEQLQRDYGLTDKQIEEMAGENAERADADMERKGKFFDSGMTPGLE
jgi:hypothetical protein